jgi:hypothetical protein
MVGTGKLNDPIRPEFVPSVTNASRDGIISGSMQLTDDKSMALDGILNDKRAEIRVFEIGKRGKAEIEKELKKYRKDFDLDKFRVVAQ